jgi:hypothetical protein
MIGPGLEQSRHEDRATSIARRRSSQVPMLSRRQTWRRSSGKAALHIRRSTSRGGQILLEAAATGARIEPVSRSLVWDAWSSRDR